MSIREKMVLACVVLGAIVLLGIAVVAFPEKTTVRVTIPTQTQTACACGGTPTTVPVRKYLIFWKEKDGYKASQILFPTLESASAAIPRDAEEARIVPVRID